MVFTKNRLPEHRLLLSWTLVGLVFADLFLFGHSYNPVGAVADLMPITPSIAALNENVDGGRVVARQLDGQVNFGPNVMSIYGLSEPGGYSSLHSARLSELVAADDPDVEVAWMNINPNIIAFSNPSRRLLDILGVTHTISPSSRSDLGVRAVVGNDTCQQSTDPITAEHPISGSFQVDDVAINRLDLRFRQQPEQSALGGLVVRMWEGVDRHRQVLEEVLNASDLNTLEPVTLYFEPEREAPGKTYMWTVTARDAASGGIGLCTDSSGEPAISVYGADWAEVHAGNVFVYERLAPAPHAYVVYGAEHIPTDDLAVERLLADSFDPRNSAVTAEALDLPRSPARPATPAEIINYGDSAVRMRAIAHEPGLLVLSDHGYPGWEAHVDGAEVPVIRVNHIMRGVRLSPGEHDVDLRFAPESLKLGIAIMLTGLIATVALGTVGRRMPWPEDIQTTPAIRDRVDQGRSKNE